MPILISAAIIVRNEEANIAASLASLLGWVDEVVVVDGGSTDRTVEIAQAHGARTYVRPPRGTIDEDRPFAVDQCRGEWIFHIDADEVVPAALGQRLREAALEGDADVFEVPEMSWFLGEPCNVWRGRKARLFRRSVVVTSDRIHAMYVPGPGARIGTVHVAPGEELQHYWTHGVGQLARRLERYTLIEAAQDPPLRDLRLKGLRTKTARAFFGAFLVDGGWSKGWRGFYLSLHKAFYRATVEVRRAELALGGEDAIRRRYQEHAKQTAQNHAAAREPAATGGTAPDPDE